LLSYLPVIEDIDISSREQVDEMLRFADEVIVGSYLMENLMNATDRL
jgi:tryptophan synthase alpha subunit